MFRKVLVANRGEIAVRVMRTLREMNIASVAVYSDADQLALHTRTADEAFPVGPAPSRESYLRVEAILEVAKRAGCDAVHPGYGFLSEKAEFRRACDQAGIAFIGPAADAMDAMGYKTSARERMIAAGVPVVPGANVHSLAELEAAALNIGFPVMLKAAGGGGGKGMRFVERVEDLKDAYARAKSEALSAFSDAHVYVEKAILSARHVEIQVLGDQHGDVVYLGERDCSIQRRHQKVVEETPSPSPVRTPSLIAKMGEVAVKAAKAVQYHSAGTVEFLLDPKGNFYFLEMNTRLQVEHPITELVTGIDLVREMVRIAAGEKLGYGQSDIVPRGAAIQCRIYAEDPSQGFVPSPGTIRALRTPAGPFVRDDSGVYEGAEISSHYDPMISKLCVFGRTRSEALDRMRRALSEYQVLGIRTNLPFHEALLRNSDFLRGDYDTNFIAKHEAELLHAGSLHGEETEAALVASLLDSRARSQTHAETPNTPALSAWRIGTLARMR